MEKRTIRVRGSAKVTAAPDLVVISFRVESLHYEYENCMKELSARTESLRKELVSIGLEKEQLKTVHFDVDTRYEHKRDHRRIFKGYQAFHDMKVEFPMDTAYLNKVLNVLSQTESYATFDISFQIKNPEPVRQQVIAQAIKNCREKAQVLSEAGGITLGNLMHIDYSWSEVHFQSELAMTHETTVCQMPDFDFSPEDIDVSDSVTVVWEIV